MTLSLNHFSIRTLDMEATKNFYSSVIGLEVGPRPNFPFPGIWLYSGDISNYANAVVHVIGLDPANPNGLNQYLGERDNTGLHGSGAVDHLAFFVTGLSAKKALLAQHKVAYTEREVPVLGLIQLFLHDPSGIVIELNYPSTEKVSA
jgi:catechol 2,3-dioxygenase-like lactoylglutathione lyase family enzyme